MSGSKKSLVGKLAEACDAVGGIEKKGTNQKQNYKYVRAADVAKAFRHELFERGIVLIGDERELIQLEPIPTQSGGKLNMVAVKVEYTLLDSESTDKIVASGYGIGMDSGDKAIYKAKTGALKYFLRGLGLIPDEKDDPENDEDMPTFQKSSDNKTFVKQEPEKRPKSTSVQTPNISGETVHPPEKKSTSFPFGANQDSANPPNAPAPEQGSQPSSSVSPVANIHGLDVKDSDVPKFGQAKETPSTPEEQKAIKERLHALLPDGNARTKLFNYMKNRFRVTTLSELPMSKWNVIFDELGAGTIKEVLPA